MPSLRETPALVGVFALARQVARSAETPVLILGERGSGIDDVAHFIHQESHPNGTGRFVSVLCRGVREDITERALLDLRRSRDTAHPRPATVFVDDVGVLGAGAQEHLADLIGSQRSPANAQDRASAIRVIAGARRPLTMIMDQGPVREDLIEALSIVRIRVPALRDRREDIVPTAKILVREQSARLGRSIRGLLPAAQKKLCGHRFPGNQRELEAVIERAVICESGEFITADSISFLEDFEPGISTSLCDVLHRFLWMGEGDPPSLAEVERAYIGAVLARMNGNRTATARLLRVSYPTVAKKIAEYRLDSAFSTGQGLQHSRPVARPSK